MIKRVLLAAAIAAGASSSAGVTRVDEVPVRVLRNGSAAVLSVVEDPETGVSCYIAYSGMSCFQRVESAPTSKVRR